MADNPITEDMMREAGLAARSSVSGLSISAQDFSFGESMFNSAQGNADGASVSGVGSGVSDIAVERAVELDLKERKKDDPANDAALLTEISERLRKERLRIGQITASREELIAFSQAMENPEFREAFRQRLREQGVPEDELDEKADRAKEFADLGVKVIDGTATAADKARLDELERDDSLMRGLETEFRYFEEPAFSTDSQAEDGLLPASGKDADFLAMMGGDSTVMIAPDRQGSTIAQSYNDSALGRPSPQPSDSLDNAYSKQPSMDI